MNKKDEFFLAVEKVRGRRSELYSKIGSERDFIAAGGKIYPYDTLAANLDPLFLLLDSSNFLPDFESGRIRSVCDVGCANGELAIAFALSGFDCSVIDYTYVHDRAPYVVQRISQEFALLINVVDMSVDTRFTLQDMRSALITKQVSQMPDNGFDLIVCFGLLYHLKNPFAFLESLSKLGKRVLLGTHLFTHLPGLRVKLDTDPVAYLVDSEELNNDPTNFWVLTEAAFHRLVKRAGFNIVTSLTIPNNPHGLAVPDRPDLGVRGFVALEPKAG